jgi:2-polyprenyl-6-hydroxyphenyl methylase/3-demethylubiquinone-9 3-methyltransferase
MMGSLVRSQIWLSSNFDKLLPNKFRIDGNQDFIKSLVPKYLKKNCTIYDIGCGKTPLLSPDKKKALDLTIVGFDIDNDELEKAKEGSYDKIICDDITKFNGDKDADLVICQALLEHVEDVEGAFSAISSVLKPGGLALIFVPSKYAVFARLNVVMPQKLKKYIMYKIYPDTKLTQGFPAYYNKCTPSEFKKLASINNLTVIEERYYFVSGYFSFFFPAYLVWRMLILLFYFLSREQSAETFSLVLKKNTC